MLSRRLFHILMLACALFVAGSLTFLSQPARAQLLAGSDGVPASSAQVSLKSDLGLPFGPKQRLGRKEVQKATIAAMGKKVDAVKSDPQDTCWNADPHPDPSGGAGFTVLNGVAAASPNDVWAVGNYCVQCGTELERQRTLIEHWNGNSWNVVISPNRGTDDNLLNAVVAFSRDNAWAVGESWDGTRYETLILHWDGHNWSIVPSPNPGTLNNYLFDVAATSPHDIWAVGTYRTPGGPLLTLTEHYDGRTWTVIPSASPGTGRNVFSGVTVLSPNNVWAAGLACDNNICTENAVGLIEHWDGHNWSIVPSPNPGAGLTAFESISASKRNDIWAVGYYCIDIDCPVLDLVVEHYDGRVWRVVSTHPFSGSEFSAYWGVLALSKNDVWIPGSYSADGVTWTNLLRHWDGRNWSNVPVSNPGAYNNDLRDVAALKHDNDAAEIQQGQDMWAVGDYDAGIDQPFGFTQIQHRDKSCR